MKRDWLASIRTSKEKTHEDVAIQVEISREYYTMIENGVRNPSVTIAKRIAQALEFDWTLFFELKGNITTQSGCLA
ncbi:helix-turn-helix transcriptional regulator [Alicyclobacillus sp. SO9]|uniref:helix-turn-helix transcriptional regulator n=1 Tax=Alicyclobacillus sp. SO9 TaxID=2665646 RepID=UPI0018E6EB0C|nr:helix-turn-helix transcriptional regulator [Alicyclobacillus sp. SO9]QQE79502.1 helix-turn-helix transcriptional regulator [Alicyclobacillus sp. SO9]